MNCPKFDVCEQLGLVGSVRHVSLFLQKASSVLKVPGARAWKSSPGGSLARQWSVWLPKSVSRVGGLDSLVVELSTVTWMKENLHRQERLRREQGRPGPECRPSLLLTDNYIYSSLLFSPFCGGFISILLWLIHLWRKSDRLTPLFGSIDSNRKTLWTEIVECQKWTSFLLLLFFFFSVSPQTLQKHQNRTKEVQSCSAVSEQRVLGLAHEHLSSCKDNFLMGKY